QLLSLAEIFHPGVAHDGNDGVAGFELFGESQRGDDIGASGSPRKETFFPRQSIGHGHGSVRGNPFNPIGDVITPEWHDKARSDPINLVSTCLAARQNRGFGGLHGDDSDLSMVAP